MQSIKFNFFPIETYVGVLIRILTAYFILKSIGVTFIDKFVKVMYNIAIISLFFYFFIFLFPNLEQILINNFTTFAIIGPDVSSRYSIFGLYTIVPDTNALILLNSGPFWEKGAFGGYLVIALLFNLLKDDNLKNKINLILIITIITTQSTTAYLALFVLLFFIYYKRFKNIIFKIIITFLILISSYYAYTTFDFLGKKIDQQLKMAKVVNTHDLRNADSQRFINILKDWNDFQGHEFIGRGPNPKTRYSGKSYTHEIRTVGITDLVVRYGLPFFLLVIYLLYLSIKRYEKYVHNYNKFQTIGIVFVILIILMSEVYFNYPFFWSLVFLFVIFKDQGLNYLDKCNINK